jgi:uncharacterized protein YecE (DUF72 family)
MGEIRIGISGWRYAGWRGVFYPKDLAQRRELEYASRALPSIEINGSFYSLQRPQSYARWYRETPDDFVFSVKGSRFITHILRLRDIEKPLANPALLEAFFKLLPRDAEQALALARRRDQRMKGRAKLSVDRNRKLRHAIEIRHESFVDKSFVELLRRYDVALVVADTAGKWPLREDVTADFVYIRLHGDVEIYSSGYTEEALDRWADRIRAWSTGSEPRDARRISPEVAPSRRARDVYCYFDNDVKVKAPFDAQKLIEKLGLARVRSIRSTHAGLSQRAAPRAVS